MRLQLLESPGQHSRHREVEHRRHDERRHIELALYDRARDAQQVIHRENVDERRILDEVDRLIRDRRQHDADHLRQDDAPHRLPVRHAERLCRLVLASRHRLDARTEDLREIRRVVQREREQRRRDIRQQDAHHRQREIDEEQLQHQRRAAHEPDIELHEP